MEHLSLPATAALPPAEIDPENLPPVMPVQTASKVLGIGRNRTYTLIARDEYPVRVLDVGGRLKVSKYDLLAYLGAPGYGAACERAS